ncbi:MAG TPA: hypothetical protein VEA60_13360 [Allosphingosinicella sp.]|nr:hypothetical protein [Allosphingosinicella sp.]
MAMTRILRLKPAFTDQQAEALASLFDEELATKADLERLRLELKADVEKLRLEVERDIKSAEARLVAWLFGQGLAVVALLFALLRFVGD